MKTIKPIKYLSILTIVLLISACGGSGDDDGGGDNALNPEAAILVFPLENSECNEGTVISETESNVTFEWNAAANAEKYTVVLTNLQDGTSQNLFSSTTTKQETLLRGVPYSWYVISKSNSSTNSANSETWKFYNAADAVANYAPFPAELVSPPMGGLSNTTVNLTWIGGDIDNDIDNYDVYLGTSNPPTTLEQSTSNSSLGISALTANTVYYWSVVTHDSHGSTTQSPVFEFRTQ